MVTRPSLVGPIIDVSPSLTERAIEAVRMAIRNGTMVPGELYTVNQLATELGVSRGPVRDALLRLEETGMIKFERYRGFRLQLPGPAELAQIFAVRVALEIPAARGGQLRQRCTDRRTASRGRGAPEGRTGRQRAGLHEARPEAARPHPGFRRQPLRPESDRQHPGRDPAAAGSAMFRSGGGGVRSVGRRELGCRRLGNTTRGGRDPLRSKGCSSALCMAGYPRLAGRRTARRCGPR